MTDEHRRHHQQGQIPHHLSGLLLSYRKPMKIPIDLSPSPPLIDLSEANYEEIDSLIEKCPRLILDKLQYQKEKNSNDLHSSNEQQTETIDENVDIPEVAEIPRFRKF